MLKSYNFWIRLVAVVVLLLRVVGTEFGFSIDAGLIIDIATAVASVLVVLGVIQVPADTGKTTIETETNIKGGEEMNSYEQIKNDITLAKDKLLKAYENSETLQEIMKLLDKILGTNMDETLQTSPIELNTIVIGEDEPMVHEEVNEAVEKVVEEPIITDYQPTAEPEDIEEVIADEPSIVPTEIPTGEETEAKIKEVLRAKLMEILDRDLDDIISQIS